PLAASPQGSPGAREGAPPSRRGRAPSRSRARSERARWRPPRRRSAPTRPRARCPRHGAFAPRKWPPPRPSAPEAMAPPLALAGPARGPRRHRDARPTRRRSDDCSPRRARGRASSSRDTPPLRPRPAGHGDVLEAELARAVVGAGQGQAELVEGSDVHVAEAFLVQERKDIVGTETEGLAELGHVLACG